MEYVLVGGIAAVFTAVLTVKKKALTLWGAVEAAVLIMAASIFGKWFGLTFLLAAYYMIAGIDKLVKPKTEGIVRGMNQKDGPRDHIQVLSNGLPALICIVIFGFTDNRAWLVGYGVALTEAFADSVASDVGVLSRSEPVSICRFKPVPRGLSGGVSLWGTGAGFLGTLLCGGLYWLFYRDIAEMATVVGFGFLGCMIDSILGDLLQEKRKCPCCGKVTEKKVHCHTETLHLSGWRWLDNCRVNLISNFIATALAVGFLL